MASLTLKDLPESLLNALRKAAQADRRSLTQEIIVLLGDALRRRTPAETQVAAWRKLAGKWESDVDAGDILKRRTAGREVDL